MMGDHRTQFDLADDLRRVGVQKGDTLIVHSSFKALGLSQGGPGAVVTALCQAVADSGTLLMPTFSDPQPDGRFFLAATPSRTGAITEAFRMLAGSVRSLHPTHSVTAWGARAAEFTAGHEQTSALGSDSPFHKAAKAGAMVLMIGCDVRALSLIHVAEAIVKVSYLGRVWYDGYDQPLMMLMQDGTSRRFEPYDAPTCSSGFTVVQQELEGRGRIRRVRIGQADTLVFSAAEALEVAETLLVADPASLLCRRPICAICDSARAIVAAATGA